MADPRGPGLNEETISYIKTQHGTVYGGLKSGVPAKQNITPNRTRVLFGSSYDPAKWNIWQSQKLSQTKISIISPFSYLSKPKQKK